jgi:hypothetical protein
MLRPEPATEPLDCPMYGLQEMETMEASCRRLHRAFCDRFTQMLNRDEADQLFHFGMLWPHPLVPDLSEVLPIEKYLVEEDRLVSAFHSLIDDPCHVRVWDGIRDEETLRLCFSRGEIDHLVSLGEQPFEVDDLDFTERLFRAGIRELISPWFYVGSRRLSISTFNDVAFGLYVRSQDQASAITTQLREFGVHCKWTEPDA